jgi:hypothetical protein
VPQPSQRTTELWVKLLHCLFRFSDDNVFPIEGRCVKFGTINSHSMLVISIITNSMVYSSSLQADSRQTDQDISCLLWKPSTQDHILTSFR